MNLILLAALIVSEPTVEGLEANMLANVNASRQQYGLPALVIEPTIQQATRAWAQYMATNHTMHHASGVRENIAMGQRDTQSVHNTWMNSGGHRATILAYGVKYLGVSGYVSSSGTIYWCMRVQ